MADRIRQLFDEIAARYDELRSAVNAAIPPLVDPNAGATRLKPGDDLAAAVASIESTGGAILLTPGEYPVNLTFKARPAAAPPILIASDTANLPFFGTRIPRDAAPGLATIRAKAPSLSAVTAANRSNNVAFRGIVFGPQERSANVVALGGDKTAMPLVDDVPAGFVFDRCLWIGDQVNGQHRGVQVNARGVKIVDCGFYDMHEAGRDSQAISGWNGTENVTIENCYVEAGAENILIGGSDSASPAMIPRNVSVRRSHLSKPRIWQTLAAPGPVIKTLFEIKNCIGFRMSGCVLDQNWKKDWPNGLGLTVKCSNSKNEPWAVAADVTIEDCVIRRVGAAITLVGKDDGTAGLKTARGRGWTFRHLLIYDVNIDPWLGNGHAFDIANPPHDLTIDHVTMIGNQHSFLNVWYNADVLADKATGLKVTNNVFYQGAYGIALPNSGLGKAALDNGFAAGYDCRGNVIRMDPARVVTFPPGNGLLSAAGFDDSLDGGYHVKPGSPIAVVNSTTDGTLPGADVGRIMAAIAPGDA